MWSCLYIVHAKEFLFWFNETELKLSLSPCHPCNVQIMYMCIQAEVNWASQIQEEKTLLVPKVTYMTVKAWCKIMHIYYECLVDPFYIMYNSFFIDSHVCIVFDD